MPGSGLGTGRQMRRTHLCPPSSEERSTCPAELSRRASAGGSKGCLVEEPLSGELGFEGRVGVRQEKEGRGQKDKEERTLCLGQQGGWEWWRRGCLCWADMGGEQEESYDRGRALEKALGGRVEDPALLSGCG